VNASVLMTDDFTTTEGHSVDRRRADEKKDYDWCRPISAWRSVRGESAFSTRLLDTSIKMDAARSRSEDACSQTQRELGF